LEVRNGLNLPSGRKAKLPKVYILGEFKHIFCFAKPISGACTIIQSAIIFRSIPLSSSFILPPLLPLAKEKREYCRSPKGF
jgi:hypothetical protein